MVDRTDEQKELEEKLKILDKDVRILWKANGLVSLIDGLVPIPITKDTDSSVKNFLMEYSHLFGFKKDLSDIKFSNKTYGIDSLHFSYQQFHEDIPVFHTFINVHLNSERKITLVKNQYRPDISLDTKATINGGISKEDAIKIVEEELKAEARLRKEPTTFIEIIPIKENYYLTWGVNIALKNPIETYIVYVNIIGGEIIRKLNLHRKKENGNDKNKETGNRETGNHKKKETGKGRVFIPNPVVSLKNIDISPESDPLIFEDAYTKVVLKGLDGSGFLRGEYVDTADTPRRAYETSLLFYYTKGDSKFCEVMAYYHIDACQRFIQELGFKNICNKSIIVNACGEGIGSFFDYDTKSITYGDIGAVKDAEDADIIIHEYAHAILDEQVPFLTLNEEGCAIEQGFGDFFAACYFSEESDGFNRECVGDWNGIDTQLKCIRRVDNQKYYPEDYKGVMTCDADGEIWSAALWDIYLTLGGNSKEKDNRIKARDRTLKIILESNFFLTPLSTFLDGAEAIISANRHLYNGKDSEKIKDVLIKRGFF